MSPPEKGIMAKAVTTPYPEDASLTPLLCLGAGACDGIISMSATYTMDLVKRRFTIQVMFRLCIVQTEVFPFQYRGIAHTLSTFLREGLRDLYKGWLPSVVGFLPHLQVMDKWIKLVPLDALADVPSTSATTTPEA
ncbi:hypothetical protein C5167_050991 [Papaver somniferum]|uniref:ADP,ATP carrier protein n=1 Tax=Papaver somniferum TaxID=3469 RepID=A0A4Y7KU94_PAPSO|nr:hypothetical protein C5167_050991 [Papaver somniferum]